MRTGNVTGTNGIAADSIGGLIGINDVGGSVSNAYATGNVVADTIYDDNAIGIGGLIGLNNSTLSQSYATGPSYRR